MKSIGTLQMFIVGLVSLTMSFSTSALAGPQPPQLIGFDEPFEITVCEDDWPTFELNIDAVNGLNYRWDKNTDQAILDQLEFSPDNTRVRFSDASALPQNVSLFLVVQSVDATGCESFPTVITLILVPKLDLIAMPLDTACVGRPFPLSPVNLIEASVQPRVDSLEWDYNGVAEVVGGEQADLEDFIIAFDTEGRQEITMGVVDNRGCTSTQDYSFDVFSAAPFPNILNCEYLGPDTILFEWTVDAGFDYELDVLSSPQGATLTETDTSLLVTGIAAGPTASTTAIEVSSEGNSPVPCNITTQTALCRSCLPVNFDFDDIAQITFCEGDDGLFPVQLTVDVITTAFIDTNPIEGAWEPGPGVEFVNGEVFFNPAGLAAGRYTVDYSYTHPIDNCPHPTGLTFTIFAPARPNASLSETDMENRAEICSDESIEIFFDTFNGLPRPNMFSNDLTGQLEIERGAKNSSIVSFGNFAQDYEVYVEYALPGCQMRTDTIFVEVSLKPEIIVECGGQQTDAVEIFWNSIDGTSAYEVFLDGVSQGIVNDTTTTVTDLIVNVDYELTIEPLALGCSSTGSIVCTTGGCVSPVVDLSALDDEFCYRPTDGPINLDVDITSGIPGMVGSYAWDTPDIDSDNNFIPSPAQELYLFDIVYTEGACREVIQGVSFTVITAPEPILILEDSICIIDGTMNLTAETIVVDPLGELTYEPNFPSGVNPTNTGPGQYILQFGDPDTYEIGITATYKGCEGEEVFTTIDVGQQIAPPVVACEEIIGAVVLTWDQSPFCVSAYDVLLGTESQGFTSALSDTVILEEIREHELTVVALSNGCNSCPNGQTVINCSPLACPPIDIITERLDTCFNPTLDPFDLDVTVVESPMLPPGSGQWSGQLIDNNGQVDISKTNFGDVFILEYTYTQGTCRTTVSEEVNLAEPPQILSIDPMRPSCPEDSLGTVIVLVGGGTPDYTYTINGGLPQADNVITEVPLGIVTVEVIDALGCFASDLTEVMEAVIPDLDIVGPEVVVQNNDAEYTLSTDIVPADIINISWFLDGILLDEGMDLFSIIVPDLQTAGTIEVVVDFGTGCTEMRTKTFDVNEVQSIYIPNIVDYSGSSSSENSEWKAFISGDEAFLLSVQIYDRYGNLLRDFENENKDSFAEFLLWDGFFGSEPAEQGVYTYVIVTEILGNTKVQRGSITILR